jgi:hypothetical protein
MRTARSRAPPSHAASLSLVLNALDALRLGGGTGTGLTGEGTTRPSGGVPQPKRPSGRSRGGPGITTDPAEGAGLGYPNQPRSHVMAIFLRDSPRPHMTMSSQEDPRLRLWRR